MADCKGERLVDYMLAEHGVRWWRHVFVGVRGATMRWFVGTRLWANVAGPQEVPGSFLEGANKLHGSTRLEYGILQRMHAGVWLLHLVRHVGACNGGSFSES